MPDWATNNAILKADPFNVCILILGTMSTHIHRSRWGYVTSDEPYEPYDTAGLGMGAGMGGRQAEQGAAPLCVICDDAGELSCRRCFGSGFNSDPVSGEPCSCTVCQGSGIVPCVETECGT